MGEDNVISLLKNGDRETLKRIYSNYKKEFYGFASRYGISESESEDIYQDAIIVMYEKARSGRLESLDCTLKTYLFSIGKYMIMNLGRQKQRSINALDNYKYEQEDYLLIEETKEPLNQYQQLLLENFSKLGKSCQEILDLFYRQGQTLDQIMDIMGYENKNVAKSQKSRCLKSLREFVNSHD